MYLETGCPWKDHLIEIEKNHNTYGEIKFIILRNPGEHRLQTVPLESGSFEFRKGIYDKWRGLERTALQEVSGIEDIVFVHNSGFIGGAKSFDSTLKMAKISLEN